MSTLSKHAAALAVAVLATGTALSQPPAVPQPPAAPQPPGTVPGSVPAPGAAPRAYRAKELLGSKINIQNNTAIGTVEDIVFTDAGEVEYLVVENAGRLVSVPWSAATYNPALRTAVVNITPEQYRVIPTFTAATYPQFFTPAYRTEVYRYYGMTPGQFRRLERRGAIP